MATVKACERRVKLPTLAEKSRTNYLSRDASLLHKVFSAYTLSVGHNLISNFI